jgi:geranylgeranyl pyrophosphate synthase
VPDSLLALLDFERPRIDAAMERLARNRLRQVPVSLQEPIRYAVAGGGKRLRPLLCVRTRSALAGGETPPAVYDAACAIEWVHTYSLVHDDLPCMDDDDLRRGRPTVHRVWGVRRASVAGALMIPVACAALETACREAGLSPRETSLAVLELTGAAGAAGMVGGQVLDLEAESRPPDIAGLERIHRMKTGALFAAALRLGGRLAHADGDILAALGRAGQALGLAFQATDDVLDETGTTAVLGKSAGRDRAHRKATYPALIGLEASRDRARAAADDALAELARAGLHDPALAGLVRFAADRDR